MKRLPKGIATKSWKDYNRVAPKSWKDCSWVGTKSRKDYTRVGPKPLKVCIREGMKSVLPLIRNCKWSIRFLTRRHKKLYRHNLVNSYFFEWRQFLSHKTRKTDSVQRIYGLAMVNTVDWWIRSNVIFGITYGTGISPSFSIYNIIYM